MLALSPSLMTVLAEFIGEIFSFPIPVGVVDDPGDVEQQVTPPPASFSRPFLPSPLQTREKSTSVVVAGSLGTRRRTGGSHTSALNEVASPCPAGPGRPTRRCSLSPPPTPPSKNKNKRGDFTFDLPLRVKLFWLSPGHALEQNRRNAGVRPPARRRRPRRRRRRRLAAEESRAREREPSDAF